MYHADQFFVPVEAGFLFGLKPDHTVLHGVNGVIFAAFGILAGQKFSAPLADDNIAGFGNLSGKQLHA